MKLLSRAVEMTQRAIFGLRVALLVCAALGLVAAHEMAPKTGVLAATSENTVHPAAGALATANLGQADQPIGEHAQPQVD